MGRSHDIATSAHGDTRYVNAAGDSMTGNLEVDGIIEIDKTGDHPALRFVEDGSNTRAYMGSGDWAVNGLANDDFGISSSSTGDLVLGSGAGTERLRIRNTGQVTNPSQPHMLAMGYKERYGTTNRHLFHTVTTNTGNHWNNVNGKFTCPVDGRYLVTAFSGYKDSTTHAGIGVGYNGAVLSYGWSLSSDRHTTQSCTIIKYAAANDYFFYHAHTSYTTPISGTGNEHHAHLSIYLLG